MSDSPATALTSGTVKLPGVGPVKKVYLYVGVGAVGVLAAYLMWRRQQAAADTTPADADLGTGLTTDPGSDVYGGANAGGAPTPDPDITPMPKTNVEWTQQVLDYFNWLEPGYITTTVGKYLARIPLSSEEAAFIRSAWAARGKPPEGPDNFTLSPGGNAPGTTTHPSVPTGLKATTVSASSIALDWADSSDATGYQVFRGSAQVGSPASSNYTDTGLASGTSYTYTVKAVNGANVSAASAAATAKTSSPPSTNPPPKPTPKPAVKPTYITVPVVAFHEPHPAWNSTIAGIAEHYGYGANWSAVWNDPKNIGLRNSRKQPDKIRAGDKVYVKKK